MAKETPNYIKLGILVTVGLVLLVVGLYFIGSNKNLFGSTFKLYAVFKDVNGLKAGNNVRYAGIDVGTVENILINNDTTIRVEMVIEERMKDVIKKNSIAGIGTDGLMGDRLINIDAASSDAIKSRRFIRNSLCRKTQVFRACCISLNIIIGHFCFL